MQGDGKNYLHSMRDKGQPLNEAKTLRKNFKNDILNRIYKSRARRAKKGDKRLWSKYELYLFGELQHPYVDEKTPNHGWKEFKGYLDHGLGDFFMSEKKLFQNVGIIRSLFTEASKRTAAE